MHYVAAGAKVAPAKARLLKASAPQPDAAAIESLRAEFPKVMEKLQLPAVSYNTWLTEHKKATGNKVLDSAARKRPIDKVDKSAKPPASPAKRLKPKVVVAPGPSPVKPPRSPKKPKPPGQDKPLEPRRLELPKVDPPPSSASVKKGSPGAVNVTVEWRNVDTERAAKILQLLA